MEAFNSSFVLALLEDSLDRFKSLVIDEIIQAINFDSEEQIVTLQRKLFDTQALLDNCQPTTDRVWQQWVADVTKVCYEVEDLVDDIKLHARSTSVFGKIWTCVKSLTKAKKVQDLQDRLESILRGLETLMRTKQQLQQTAQGCLKELVLHHQGKIFGRDHDTQNVVDMLLRSTISTVSIVGMGGLGKTTVAWNVRDDTRVQASFDHILWLSVSGKFELIKILELILHQMLVCEPSKKKKRLECECNFLANLIRDLFKGKCVLIVLDDLWDAKHDSWIEFFSVLTPSSGCKFLLTTRNAKVSLTIKATPYYLHRMKDEDCRALIMDRAIPHSKMSARQLFILEEISGTIARKCKGLPLAAHLLGLHLVSKPSEDDWMMLSERDICDMPVFREEIFPAFRLNNPDMASHLKRCFAYCSLFPHNYVFKKDNLVQLWMAEGFILPQGTSSLEEIGGNYFDELLMRSIFQVSDDSDHERPTYKLHEFISRSAEYAASDTCFRLEEGKCSSLVPWYKKVRHLSLLCHSIQMFLKAIEQCDGLRTLLLPSEKKTKVGQVPYSLFQKLLRLRVLDLSHTDIDELPESIGRLKHLRYLDVSNTAILRLPESASNLDKLELIKLRNCSKLLELPRNIKNLTSLLHLDVDIKRLRTMPTGIGSLSCLQTLPIFIAGKREGNRVTELKNLKFLRGTIILTGLQNVKDGTEAKEARLCKKPYVKKLELIWSHHSRDGSVAMDVLAGLQPHKNLEELLVTKYGGSSFPTWLTSSSCLLVSIHLLNCRQRDVLPTLGQLPFLANLQIEAMHDVKSVDYSFCGEGTGGCFPSLKSLKIKDMRSLSKWYQLPDNSMHQLNDLKIEGCPMFFLMQSLKHMKSLQRLEINRCPQLPSLPELPASLKSLIIVESNMVEHYANLKKVLTASAS